MTVYGVRSAPVKTSFLQVTPGPRKLASVAYIRGLVESLSNC